MNAKELGRRLRVARKGRGLSQQAVADSMGIPRTAVTQLEAGSRSVSTLELTRFSELYLQPIAEILHEGPGDEEKDVLVVLHRLAPGLEEDPVTHQQVSQCLYLCREGAALKRLLGVDFRSGPPSYEMRLPHTPGEAVAQGEEVAEQERRRLGITSVPIADVSDLITSQGIWASGVTLPDKMSGLFLQHSSIGLAILVNSLHPRGRKRFSYAHEYAHALLDQNSKITISSTDNASVLVEKRANAFAAAFLMPSSGVRAYLLSLDKGLPSRQEHTVFDAAGGGHIEAEQRKPARSQRITYKDSALLAHHFGVSYQAAVYRLRSLRYISAHECGGLLDREHLGRNYLKMLNMFDEVGERENKCYWDRELRNEIAHLTIEAYRREEISRGRVLELSKTLRITGDTLFNLAEAARGE